MYYEMDAVRGHSAVALWDCKHIITEVRYSSVGVMQGFSATYFNPNGRDVN